MKRALIVASVASMIDQFNMPNIRLLIESGYEVDVAANFTHPGSITGERAVALRSRLLEMGVSVTDVPIPRKILAIGDMIKSYRIIKKQSRKRKYDLMHCHSPIGGAIARLALRRERKHSGTKVVYTAHGFHFFEGAPKKNWLVYYPVEKLCARFTDALLTINREDYDFAREKLHAGRVEYIPGVGIDTERFCAPVDRVEKRRLLGIPEDAPLLFSVGELNANKNHESALRAFASIRDNRAHYAIAGKGALDAHIVELCREMKIEERVHILGYREDVAELYGIADIFVHPSYREGLPVSVIEAMSSGLPVIGSKIRGNVDLIDEQGGILLSPDDIGGFADAMNRLLSNRILREKMGAHNREVAENYSTEAVSEMLARIYEEN